MHEIDLLIGGADRKANARRTFDRRNPVTGAVASRAAAASAADARAACDAAASAFPAWSASGPGARRALLSKAADLIDARSADFAECMTAETAAGAGWAAFNCTLAANMLREAAAMTTQIGGEVIPSDVPGLLAMATREPAGVIVGIAPWNAPVILGVRALAMPLACGNTVVLKASELCPATHRLIGSVLREAGLPAGVVNVVTHAPADAADVVDALIAHPAVRRINFTGSSKVGRLIAMKAGAHLKPVLLELGGKAPLVVLDDADLDAAADAACFGAFLNQGQICMSTERIVVDGRVADEFVRRFAAKADRLPPGPVIDIAAVQRLTGLVEDAIAQGASLVAGGTTDGTSMSAHVLDHVRPGMRLYAEESFGPVVGVVRVDGVDDAVRVANDTDYGLSGAVFGRDAGRALAVARRIRSGICHVNGPTVHDEAQMPFGGMKDSGWGRFGGKAAIAEFTELRWLTVRTGAGG